MAPGSSMARTLDMTSSARFSFHRLDGSTIVMVDEATLTAITGRDNANQCTIACELCLDCGAQEKSMIRKKSIV